MKDYISHGDFLLPLEAPIYWLKHLYVWSFQTGAPNLDGIVRLPGRIFNLLVFQFFGNTTFAYFYLATALIIAFVAFFCFSRFFLKVKNPVICTLGALLFAFNPIFLGNLAKVGLIIAVAMLPLILVLIQRSFERRQVSYLLLAAALLNISLIHPFTCAVNAVVAGVYFGYMALCHREFIVAKRVSLAVVALVAVAMNVYFLLPIMRLGTVNKEAMSSDITSATIDYTTLIDIANTGDVVTALSLSKNVLKDFEFYDSTYIYVYFIVAFALYALLLGLYIYQAKKLSWANRQRLVVFFGVFLVLTLLSTGTLFHIDAIIKWLINQPGGWMFRSPLKWQLYIPLFLFGALTLLVYRTKSKVRIGSMVAMGVLLIGMNGYLAYDIYQKLLVPRRVDQLSALAKTDLSFKTMLFVSSTECTEFARQNPTLITEFNQITTSQNVQLKRVGADELGSVHMADYDYAMGCEERSEKELTKATGFTKIHSFADGALALYQNQKSSAHVFAFDKLFTLATLKNINVKDNFVTDVMQTNLRFVEEDGSAQPATGVYDIFEGLSPSNIRDGQVHVNLVPTGSDKQTLHFNNEKPLFYKIEGQKVEISVAPTQGFKRIEPGKQNLVNFTSQHHKTLDLTYNDPAYSFANIIPNPSFEEGLWQEEVGDCNNYDEDAKLSMSQSRKDATDGQRLLQLEAERHIACTWTPDIPVKEGAQYLLSFDYQSTGSKPAGFLASFNDEARNVVSENLSLKTGEWQHLSKVVTVPKGATEVTLVLYAYADDIRNTRNIARYDAFSLVELPALQNNIYLVSQAPATFKAPAKVNFEIIDPTKKTVRVQGVTTPYYLAVNETYHEQWQLSPVGGTALPASAHMRLNNGVNGWYIDPQAVCGNGGCTKNNDGSYDMQLTVEFAPQKWFIAGLVISAVAWLGALGYAGYDWFRRWQQERNRL